MNHSHIKRLVLAALSTALVFVATMIAIPTPVVGNVNLGDAVILLSVWTLGGPWSLASAALGAALADLLGPYLVYAPGTLVIKALLALCAMTLEKLFRRLRLPSLLALLLSGICAELVMVLGYFFYEALILDLGYAAAALNLPFNAIQGSLALLLGVLATRLLQRYTQSHE
ncbi:MAG: ECF transporter S component [Clostridia bacterium]|nr:ECF transporter S component [Clostridia bacterium]